MKVLQQDSKTSLNKQKILEYLFALIFVIPYMEIGIMNDLSYKQNNLYFPFILIVLSLLTYIFILTNLLFTLKGKKKFFNSRELKIIFNLKILLDLYLLIVCLFSENIVRSVFQLSYFTLPFYFSLFAVLIIIKCRLNIRRILKIGIGYFTLYALMAYMYNIIVFKIDLFSTVSSRLVTPGGGAVIFGYTIVVISSILFVINQQKSSVIFFVQLIILFIVSLATGSRGSMWPMSLLVLLFIIYKKRADLKIVLTLFIIALLMLINPIRILINNVPRFGMGDIGSRSDSTINALSMFMREDIGTILVGFGMGNFFPYQQWQILYDQYASNIFYYEGFQFLVQPHNTYIYMLIEGGIIGVSLFIAILLFSIISCFKNKNLTFFGNGVLPILILSLLCINDSLLILHPASAAQLWFILLLMVIYKKNFRQIKLESNMPS